MACLLVGTFAGFVTGRKAGYDLASDRSRRLPNGSIPCEPGPWGELTYTPFTIGAPEELIPLRQIEDSGTQWFLQGYTTDSFISLIQSTSMSPDQQHQMLDGSVFHTRPDGVELTPPNDLVLSLPDDARAKIYEAMAESDQSEDQLNFIPMDAMDSYFGNSGVSQATMALFRKLCVPRGRYLMFACGGALLSQIPTYEERIHFAQALTRQRTMLLNLHITAHSDVEALARYWGVGCGNTDVRSILRSLSSIPNGTYMNIQMLLPDQPSAWIYDYPRIVDNPMDGPVVNRDCAWTSFNFFRETPDPRFGQLDGVMHELDTNYIPVTGDPRYGDMVLFVKPNGNIIHVAIYIADNICFTKNGSTLVHPWMLSTTSDILEQFSCQIAPNEKLSVRYFRNKTMGTEL